MVSIDVARINKTSPYKVVPGQKNLTAKFTTDFGVDYLVGFDIVPFFPESEVYEFAITNLCGKSSPRDPKLRGTIMAIVYDFFLSSETAMLYICDTSDGRQAMRDRLFHYWANTEPRLSHFVMHTTNVTDEEGITNYATIVLRADHPRRREVIEEFIATADALNDKPNE